MSEIKEGSKVRVADAILPSFNSHVAKIADDGKIYVYYGHDDEYSVDEARLKLVGLSKQDGMTNYLMISLDRLTLIK
jgi:hypothetical protein